ncbi:MAG: hypothetical protein LBC99_09670 [Spirochaetota bacterium]|nr:hypothetical protein [Spirochaetota bacterium]
MQRTPDKNLIRKLISISFFTLAGLLILLYILLHALEDPRVLKRTFGFDNFASFVLMSGGGILTVAILSALVILLIRSLLFSKKLRGPTDALHRVLRQFSEGDYDPNPEATAKLPEMIQKDIDDLRSSLITRYDTVERSLKDLKEIAENLRRITVESSLRISFLHTQLDNFDKGVNRLEKAFAHIRVPRPDTFSSILVFGGGPEALALASALIINEDTEFVWLYRASAEDIDCLTASLPVQGKARFGACSTGNENDLIDFARRSEIPLAIVAEANEELMRLGETLAETGIPAVGFGIRSVKIAHEEAYFRTLLAQARVVCLPPVAIPDQGRELALTGIADKFGMRILGAADLALRAENGNQGRMTAGVGAYSPAYTGDSGLPERVHRLFCKRIQAVFRREGIIHRGFVSLRLWESETGYLMLRSFSLGLKAPECEVNLLSFGHGTAKLALAASKDELAMEDIQPTGRNAISIVFRADHTCCAADGQTTENALPETPWNMRIARYPRNDPDGRVCSLVCSRASEAETLHAAYLAALPILQEGHMLCREDMGNKAVSRQKPARSLSFLHRITKWLTSS